uniref:Uncharacterized protein n=1 Tax=Anopheles dirus TaxID=7168 RepID=A0A182NWJ5_9DIPT
MFYHYVYANVHALSCKFCQSVNSYSNCIDSAGQVECSDTVVNMTHLLLVPHNPSLAKVVPTDGQYQCFQVNFTSNGVWNYQMGCTFAGSKLCDGWKVLSQCTIPPRNGAGKTTGVMQAAATPAQLSTLKPRTPAAPASAGVAGKQGVQLVSSTTTTIT